MTLQTIPATKARQLLGDGAVLIDVRESDEHARERIQGAINLPLSLIDEAGLAAHRGRTVLFHCKSGARTAANASRLAMTTNGACEAFIVEGGLEAWRKEGFPVVADRGQPIELQRQVQIGAGGLALVGTLAGLFLSPWFLAVPALVGGGLLAAGVTGFCGMARLLMRAPWNRQLGGASPRVA